MKKKFTPAKIARIRERRATGETLESLSKAFGCSVSTMHAALAAPAGPSGKSKSPPPKPRASSKPPTEAPAGDLPTPDDIRRSLAAQVRDLQADVAGAETPAARSTANRLLVSAQQLLSRVTPPDLNVAPPGMILVNAEEIEALAARGSERLQKLVHDLFAEERPK